jgi:protein-disulfide isomerase
MNKTAAQRIKKYLPAFILLGFLLTLIMLFFKISVWTPKRNVPEYRRWGYKEAPIKVVVFTDLQCPACSWAHANLKDIKQEYPDKILLSFKHRPLSMHKWAFDAATAAECAGKQNMFYEYADELFSHQENWHKLQNALPYFLGLAENLPLDMPKFYECMEGFEAAGRVRTDLEEAIKRKINAAPTFFVNGCNADLDELKKELFEKFGKYENNRN